jgi:hypothetical protein
MTSADGFCALAETNGRRTRRRSVIHFKSNNLLKAKTPSKINLNLRVMMPSTRLAVVLEPEVVRPSKNGHFTRFERNFLNHPNVATA